MSVHPQLIRRFPFNRHDKPPRLARSEKYRKRNLSWAIGGRQLDRVNVLGNDISYGHTGCVNALSWARDGELLLSGGDDQTVRIWRMDPSEPHEYPFVCRSIIRTGHRANIFNAHMLPYSSRIATVAGDQEVRIFDIGESQLGSQDGRETWIRPEAGGTRVLRCHHDRVKRITLEDSPDVFLTVGEDGSVRQHDLRTSHDCRREQCPTPLVKVNHELSTLALSPLTPYHFVVAGESPYGLLFDRRQTGRYLKEEWGMVPAPGEDDLTTCVRRFGLTSMRNRQSGPLRGHITGARMSAENGHEVLLSYSSDGIYLFSTQDDVGDNTKFATSVLAPNAKRLKVDNIDMVADIDDQQSESSRVDEEAEDILLETDLFQLEEPDEAEEEEEEDELDQYSTVDEDDRFINVSIVLPRRQYKGARNVETVKDVNFLGPHDEFVTSGSDDGNFFIWDKATGALEGIYEGDGSVVNVIEGHPHLPLIAVSGIDKTVKLFAPTYGPSCYSRTGNAERIIEVNSRRTRNGMHRHHLIALLAQARQLMGGENTDSPECTHQ
ncbi:WD40 repeat-like protein [Pluteus cervinus]|uniref:WD40 repeat-like protein n=1 Tax=Pluteus cervinus TaxID=181527 RepID=A0ACD3BDZ8_9AGAR|nr:WD40 repeat-like protein [Pluteus cervinus]